MAALVFLRAGTDVMILKMFLQLVLAKKMAFFTQNKSKLCKILIITLWFFRKTPIFSPKNAENRDHNIDPCLEYSENLDIFPTLVFAASHFCS
jgi:hypothetical protein